MGLTPKLTSRTGECQHRSQSSASSSLTCSFCCTRATTALKVKRRSCDIFDKNDKEMCSKLHSLISAVATYPIDQTHFPRWLSSMRSHRKLSELMAIPRCATSKSIIVMAITPRSARQVAGESVNCLTQRLHNGLLSWLRFALQSF